MTGARHLCRTRGADRRSPLSSLVWLLAALSILQWTAPRIDPAAFAQLSAEAPHKVGLNAGDPISGAVLETRAATVAMVVEKRAPGSRIAPAGPDDGAVDALPVQRTGRLAGADRAGSAGRTASGTLAGFTFSARSPPRPA